MFIEICFKVDMHNIHRNIFKVLLCFFMIGTITVVSSEESIFDKFTDFIDSIGDYIEDIDVSSFVPDFGYNRNHDNRYHMPHYYDNWMDRYLYVRGVDSLLVRNTPVVSSNSVISNPINISVPIPDKILKQSLIAATSITLTFFIVFLVIDIIKRRTIRGKRLGNLLIFWILGIFGCISLYLMYHLIILCWIGLVTFLPYFWPYFLGINICLLVLYCVVSIYKRWSLPRRFRVTHEHIV